MYINMVRSKYRKPSTERERERERGERRER